MSLKKLMCCGMVALMAMLTVVPKENVYANEAEVRVSQEAVDEQNKIDLLDQYVTVTSDGVLELNAPASVIEEVWEEYYAELLIGIENVNEMAEQGEVEITENGSIYETNDENLVIQGGGVDKNKTYWWGTRRWACKRCANTIAKNLSKVSTGAWGVSAIAGIIGGPVGIGAAIGGAIGAVRAGWMSDDISYYNGLTSRGVIIDCGWVLTYDVKCQ